MNFILWLNGTTVQSASFWETCLKTVMLAILFGATKGTAAEGEMYKCFIHSLLLFLKNQLVEEQPNTFHSRHRTERFGKGILH